MRVCSLMLFATVGVVGLCGDCPAQEDASREVVAPLRGPEVTTERIPGIDQEFTTTMQRPRGRVSEVPQQVFTRILREMGREDAPAEVRLTQMQTEEIRALVRAHEARRREARKNSPSDISDLDDDGATMQGSSSMPLNAEMDGERMGGKGSGATVVPRAIDLQTKVWLVLTEEQRALVEGELAAYAAEREAARRARYLQQRGLDGETELVIERLSDEEIVAMLPQRFQTRLKAMSPENRKAALTRARARLASGGGNSRGSGGLRHKAPPRMDSVVLPKPEPLDEPGSP